MNEMMKNLKKQDCVAVIAMFLLLFGYFFCIFGISWKNLHSLFGYSGYGDGLWQLLLAKTIDETGWITHTLRLGDGVINPLTDFPAILMDNYGNLILKFYILLTSNTELACSLTILTFPFITAWVSYSVFRAIGIKPLIAVLSALTYTLVPFWFFRSLGHYSLAELQSMPLTLLLCFWLYHDETFFCVKKSFFTYKKNVVALLICVWLANSGIGYYQFYSCGFIFMIGIIKSLSERKLSCLARPMVISGIIGTLFFCNMMPSFWYNYQHGENKLMAVRSSVEADIYGSKISYMLLPQDGSIFPSEKITQRYEDYVKHAPLHNENTTAYLGPIGVIGFFALFISLIGLKNNCKDPLYWISRLNLFAILFSTIGGFSVLFSIFVTPMLRSHNRISNYVACFCIFSVGWLLQKWITKGDKFKLKSVACIFAFMTALYSQVPVHPIWDFETSKQNYAKDHRYIGAIEDMLPVGAKIYQMPYMRFPENGPIKEMHDYSHLIGYVHSNTLVWSYGGVYGREADKKYRELSELPLEQQLEEVDNLGYSGIYIDTRAYDVNEYEQIKTAIKNKFGVSPMMDEDNKLAFFKIR